MRKQQVISRLSPKLYRRFKLVAISRRRSINACIVEAMRDYISKWWHIVKEDLGALIGGDNDNGGG